MTSVRRICGPLGILGLFLLVQPAPAAAIPTAGVAAEALAVTYRPHHRQKRWGYHNYRYYHDRVPRHPHTYRADDYRARYYPYFGLHHGYRYHSRPYFRTPLYYHFHF